VEQAGFTSEIVAGTRVEGEELVVIRGMAKDGREQSR
jgi:hypothetical protein